MALSDYKKMVESKKKDADALVERQEKTYEHRKKRSKRFKGLAEKDEY